MIRIFVDGRPADTRISLAQHPGFWRATFAVAVADGGDVITTLVAEEGSAPDALTSLAEMIEQVLPTTKRIGVWPR